MKNYYNVVILIVIGIVIFNFGNFSYAVETFTAAVLDFEAGEGVSKGTAMTLSDYLRTQLVNTGKFTIVNRENMEQLLKEQKFQMTGFTEKDVAQAGKLLGVNKVFIGSIGRVGITYLINLKIVDVQTGRIEKAETEECGSESQLLAGMRNLVNRMIGVALKPSPPVSEAPPPPVAPAPVYVQPYQPPKVSRGYGFVDILFGYAPSTMDLTFKKSDGMYNNWIGVDPDYFFYKKEYTDLKTGNPMVLGVRIGGFFEDVLGLDVEFSYESHNIEPQTVKCKIDGSEITSTFYDDNYLTVRSIPIWVDLLLRIPAGDVDPYFGAGFGLSLNFIDGPTLKGYTLSSTFSAPTLDIELGYGIRIPFGVRIRIARETSLFIEGRYQYHTISFDRDIKNERDEVTIKSFQLLAGIGFTM